MSLLIDVLVPVFIMIGLGYVAVWRKLVSEEGLRGLNDFAFYLAMPCLIFASATSEHPGSGPTAVVFFTGCLLTYAIGMLLGRLVLRLPGQEVATFGLNTCFGNTAMIGIPVMLAAYGQAGLAQILAIVGLHSLVLLPLATMVAEIAGRGPARPIPVLRATLMAVARNPIVLAVLLGQAFAFLHIPVPGAIRRFLELAGLAGPAVALFCLGASLIAFQFRRDWAVALLGSLVKLLLMPALVWLLGRWMGLPPLSHAVAVVAAAMPTGANAFFLSRRYAAGAQRSGATVLLSTLLAVGTVGLLLLLMPVK